MGLIRLRNTETNEEVILDTKISRYRRLAQGFLNSLKMTPRFVKHIVLTQKQENYKPNILNPFFVKLRRYYGNIAYIWTVEAQERGVLHWHVLVGFDYDIEFTGEDVIRIQKYWKYGNVNITPVRKANLGYIMKYLTKALDTFVEELYNLRRIGSSMIEGWLRQSWQNLSKAMEYFFSVGVSLETLINFYWIRGNAYVFIEGKHRLWLYKRKTSWIRVESFDILPELEPF